MPKIALTEAVIQKTKQPQTRYVDYYDSAHRNLVLRVNAGGKRSWLAVHYTKAIDKNDPDGNKLKTISTSTSLGEWPKISHTAAVKLWKAFDPHKPKQNLGETFKTVADSFIARYVEKGDTGKDGKRREPLRTKDEIVRCLDKYVRPVWDARLFRSIKRSEVADLLDTIEDKHGARQADYVLAILRKIMRWYATRADDYNPVIVPGMSRTNPEDAQRDRILNDEEIRLVWQHADGIFGALLKVALLTGQRREKVSTMKHRDIVDGVWTIPAEPREKNVPGALKLPQMVLDIIDQQPKITGNPFVFPGGRQGQRRGKRSGPPPFNSFSERKALLDETIAAALKKAKRKPMERWTVHDLRRTARTLMARAKVPSDHAEHVLGHKLQGVRGVYDRFAYPEEKAAALNKLAKEINRILKQPPGSSNVVAIKTAG
jgi:integrase